MVRKTGIKGCSAEGHVSHVLSNRMSSRPMGWSIQGMSKMAELRAYYYNGGDMLEVVRYQKEKLPIYSITYPQIKKIANFKIYLWIAKNEYSN